jgi:hypothetical protein
MLQTWKKSAKSNSWCLVLAFLCPLVQCIGAANIPVIPDSPSKAYIFDAANSLQHVAYSSGHRLLSILHRA